MARSSPPQGPLGLGTEHVLGRFTPCHPLPLAGCSVYPSVAPTYLLPFPGLAVVVLVLSPTRPALDLRIYSRRGGPFKRAHGFKRGNPWRWGSGWGGGRVRAGGAPLPHSSWDLFWGQRGKPRLGPLKQEKLEFALNSERVCWGLASCGLP